MSDIAIETEEIVEDGPADAILEEMAASGLSFGRKKSKTNPKMRPYIFTNRNGFEIFDLPKTHKAIEEVGVILSDLVAKKSLLLIVGTEPAGKNVVNEIADEFKFPFVTNRWLGGTLTNYQTLSKRIQHLKKLKEDKAKGRLDKYTKKERVLIDREVEKMIRLFGGLENLDRLPDAVFVADAAKNETALREARRLKIKTVALGSSDTDPALVDHLIPSNTSSRASVNWVMTKLREAMREGLKRVAQAVTEGSKDVKAEEKASTEGKSVN